MKYLLLFAVLAAVWVVLKKQRGAASDLRPATKAEGRMVVCDHCGVHFPDDDGVKEGDRHFCCDAHRQAAGK